MEIIAFTPQILPLGVVGEPYNARIKVEGTQSTFTYSLGSGSFPPGISLQADGQVVGTPTQIGEYGVVVVATEDGTQRTASKTY